MTCQAGSALGINTDCPLEINSGEIRFFLLFLSLTYAVGFKRWGEIGVWGAIFLRAVSHFANEAMSGLVHTMNPSAPAWPH